jgi:hypothetical protein
LRVAAVDWSGRAVHARRFIWTAVAAGGALHLEGDRDRDQVGDYLVDLALADPELAVGLDFGFSLPLWFLDQEGLADGPSVPEDLAERWLRDCPPPFWGRRGRRRGGEVQYRRTELEVAPAARPVFQVGGSGSVGTGSLRGFPLLRRLQAEGFSIWPFDSPRLPVAVEIFPRLLTGPVVKSRRPARESYLSSRGWPPEASISEDAFDAAVSAMVMASCCRQVAALGGETDAVYKREGRIWDGAKGACGPQ